MADRGLERFWGASGSTAPLRLQVRERGRREVVEFRFPRPFAIIGRSEPADLILDHPQVSRRHAYIQAIGGRAYCLDLGSRSALGWGGGSRRSGWIEPGRPVEIGPFRIGVAPGGPAEAPPTPADPLADPSPTGDRGGRFELESIDEISGRHRWPIDRPLTTVGRAPECRLRLADLSVSRLHCALLRLGETLWVVDLLGRGGLEVDDEPARWAPLDDGDRLRLGRYLFSVRTPAAPALRIRDDEPPPVRAARADDRLRGTSLVVAAAPRLPGTAVMVGPASTALRAPDPDPEAEADAIAIEFPHADPARAAEAMIAPLVDQLAMMQQQMFDQYHHSMMEMVAVLARLHQDQRGVVDRELRKIRRLTKEVRSLRRELDRRREPGAPPASPALEGVRPAGPAAPSPRSTPAGTPEDYRAAQARIIARMTELQRERQGRWRRLVGRLSGGRDGG